MASNEGFDLTEKEVDAFFTDNFIFCDNGCDSVDMCEAMLELQKAGVKLFNKDVLAEVDAIRRPLHK